MLQVDILSNNVVVDQGILPAEVHLRFKDIVLTQRDLHRLGDLPVRRVENKLCG